MSRRWLLGCLATLAVCGLMFAACSQEQKRKLLPVFFDGVPTEDSAASSSSEAPATDQPGEPEPAPRRASLLDPSSPMATQVSHHHAFFASRCDACHEPDVAVTDARCTSCHQAGSHHGAEVDMTCGSCHAEHSGRLADLTRTPTDRCTACHDNAPYEEEHAEFSLIDDAAAAARAKYAGGVEVFHSIHLEAEVPEGDRADQPFHCLDCHTYDPMQPDTFGRPDYERACRSCHELAVHKSIPETDWQSLRGTLPPGADPNAALVTDARWRAFEESAPEAGQLAALSTVRGKMAEDGLEECFRCHSFVDREIDGDHYAVVPPARTGSWFRWGRFSHSAHAFLDCQRCHTPAEDAESDLGHPMLPNQATCAECHRQGGVSNACSTCHLFHVRQPRYDSDTVRQKRITDLIKAGSR